MPNNTPLLSIDVKQEDGPFEVIFTGYPYLTGAIVTGYSSETGNSGYYWSGLIFNLQAIEHSTSDAWPITGNGGFEYDRNYPYISGYFSENGIDYFYNKTGYYIIDSGMIPNKIQNAVWPTYFETGYLTHDGQIATGFGSGQYLNTGYSFPNSGGFATPVLLPVIFYTPITHSPYLVEPNGAIPVNVNPYPILQSEYYVRSGVFSDFFDLYYGNEYYNMRKATGFNSLLFEIPVTGKASVKVNLKQKEKFFTGIITTGLNLL